MLCKPNIIPGKGRKAFGDLKKHWDELLSIINVKTGNEKFDRTINIGININAWLLSICREASYYESGIGRGMGFAIPADLFGFVHLIPKKPGKE